MFTLFIFSPVLVPVGLLIALRAYPWRKPVMQPYGWLALTQAIPLAILLVLQAAFTLPPGSCTDRWINNAPLALAFASVILSAVVVVRANQYRQFASGVALILCPITLFWSLPTAMSLAGCWI